MCSRCFISYDLGRDCLLIDPPLDRPYNWVVCYNLDAEKISTYSI